MTRTTHLRRLRRLRSVLALLAAATVLLIAAACRFDSTARLAAAAGAALCLVLWVVVLDTEGRVAERLEARTPRGGRVRSRGGRTQRTSARREHTRRAA